MSKSSAMPRGARLGERSCPPGARRSARAGDGRCGPCATVAVLPLPLPVAVPASFGGGGASSLRQPVSSAPVTGRALVVVDELDLARFTARSSTNHGVVALALERIGEHVPRRAPHARDLVAVGLQLRLGDALLPAGGLEVGHALPGGHRGSRLGWHRARRPGPRSTCRSHEIESAFNSASNPSIGTRSCFIVSRSRIVTARSSSVSKSIVTHNGVPPRPGDGSGGRSSPPRRRRSCCGRSSRRPRRPRARGARS